MVDSTRSGAIRLVVVGDSIFEIFGGTQAWRRLNARISSVPLGYWLPPTSAAYPWAGEVGRPSPFGLDRRGLLLAAGQTVRLRLGAPLELPAEYDIVVWYTAVPAGGVLHVSLDGTAVSAVDTSTDERDRPIDRWVGAQRAEVAEVDRGAKSLELTSTGGDVALEAVQLRTRAALEVHGAGRGAQGWAEALEAGRAADHLTAMVDRGDPPDVVLVGCGTASTAETPAALVAQAEALVRALRRRSEHATYALYIPHRHRDRLYGVWDDVVRRLHALCADEGLVPVDGDVALGDLVVDPHGFGTDGKHLSSTGIVRFDDALYDALAHLPVFSVR